MAREPLSTIRQLELMRELQLLANERATTEARIAESTAQRRERAEREFSNHRDQIEQEYLAGSQGPETEFAETKDEINSRYESDRAENQKEYDRVLEELHRQHRDAVHRAEKRRKDVRWQAMAVFDATKGEPRRHLDEALKEYARLEREIATLENDAQVILRERRMWRPQLERDMPAAEEEVALPAMGSGDESLDARLAANIDKLRRHVIALHEWKLSRLFEGAWVLLLFVILWLLAMPLVGFFFGWARGGWLWASALLGAAACGVIVAVLYPRTRSAAARRYLEIGRVADRANGLRLQAADAARQHSQDEAQAIVARRDQELLASDDVRDGAVAAADEWREAERVRLDSIFPSKLEQLDVRRDEALAAANAKYPLLLQQLATEREQRQLANTQQREKRIEEVQRRHDAKWRDMSDHWWSGLAAIQASLDDMAAQCAAAFPDWSTTEWQSWSRPTDEVSAIRFGECHLDLAQIKNGIPTDDSLRPSDAILRFPALMALREHPVMLIDTSGAERSWATEVIQLAMLRFLTALPAGRVRFTILDPERLGESFAAFAHLADFDEQLISGRIWSESRDIEQRLAALTEHMEKVIQKYLRNEFASLFQYNQQAGEVAEPYQVLAIADFPSGFSDISVRRLLSIAKNGARCGVYTLIAWDRGQPLPPEFDEQALREQGVCLHLDGKKCQWRYPAFERLPLALDRGIAAERLSEIVRLAGQSAKEAIRVEVPFSLVAPGSDAIWTANSSTEIDVPIGRAGAKRLQHLRLGTGTAQHALIAGKTGSGKSTLLHAMITNLALRYGPDEVAFYLVDFKKGVEFKTYATHQLPHARVIAIESEREFGISVLERLDFIMKRRGDLFRRAGVQDLSGYRVAEPAEPMPRLLLIIDEFQEFFVEDDKLAHDASLLLDRLVRQGRAFGIHVLLGSQTLAGAYSLARSTLGQMAVRVALECSDADAHIILSDENTAARLLSRPGEAIYNDQSGLLSGNHSFQVAWLPDGQREHYLAQIRDAQLNTGRSLPPPIVFEGNVLADIADNGALAEQIGNHEETSVAQPRSVWFGASVSIKDPTGGRFARQSGSNLVVVGHQEEPALGVLAASVVALAAQQAVAAEVPPDQRARLLIIDGGRPESSYAGMWRDVADALPQTVEVARARDAAASIADVAEELSRRDRLADQAAQDWYLLLYDLGRLRELRRNENDFSFSRDSSEPPSPAQQLAEILREGPHWGIHTLIWCDNYNNLNRALDRSSLRDLEMRVVFQMNANDSSNLIETPAASRLEQQRGLFYSDDRGTAEKFRPYAPPTAAWLEAVRSQLLQREPTE